MKIEERSRTSVQIINKLELSVIFHFLFFFFFLKQALAYTFF